MCRNDNRVMLKYSYVEKYLRALDSAFDNIFLLEAAHCIWKNRQPKKYDVACLALKVLVSKRQNSFIQWICLIIVPRFRQLWCS